MKISYNKLWKLLIDKKMRQSDLRRAANIAPNTLTRLYKDQDVKLDVLYRICMVLDADIGDIMEFLPETEETKQCDVSL
jgi:DNA-binding Xre family transcriptional regulator